MSDKGPSFASAVGRSDRRALMGLALLFVLLLCAAPVVLLHAAVVVRRQARRRHAGAPPAGSNRNPAPLGHRPKGCFRYV